MKVIVNVSLCQENNYMCFGLIYQRRINVSVHHLHVYVKQLQYVQLKWSLKVLETNRIQM